MDEKPAISADVVNRILYGNGDRQRFTQDTPILPEVWQNYAARPGARQDHYVASADGTFGNPDRATLEMLIDKRGKAAVYTIHLTYPLAGIDARRKEEWDKDRTREIKDGKPHVRPAWNPAGDDLAALFAKKKSEGFAFSVAAPAVKGQSAKVDLLGPIP